MRRKVVWFLMATLIVAAGCGDDDSDSQAATTTVAPTITTTTVAPTTVAPTVAPTTTTEVKKLTIAMFPGSLSSIIPVVAEREGFFQDNGLEIDVIDATSGPFLVATLLSGDTDIANTPINVLLPLMDSEGLVAILAGGGAHLNLIRLADAPPSDWPNANSADPKERLQDLVGKTVAVVARGGIVDEYLSRVLEEAGLEADEDVYVVATGGAATAIPSLEENQVDAMVAFTPIEQLLGTPGQDFEYIVNSVEGELSVFEGRLTDTWTTTQSFIEQEPAMVDQFCRAMLQAADFLADPANREAAVEGVAEAMSLSSQQAEGGYDGFSGLISPALSRDDWTRQGEYVNSEEIDMAIFELYLSYVYEPCGSGAVSP